MNATYSTAGVYLNNYYAAQQPAVVGSFIYCGSARVLFQQRRMRLLSLKAGCDKHHVVGRDCQNDAVLRYGLTDRTFVRLFLADGTRSSANPWLCESYVGTALTFEA